MAREGRFIRADRVQRRWDFVDLDGLPASARRARIVTSFVEGLDLSSLYAPIKSREGEPGRPPPDPLLGLRRIKARSSAPVTGLERHTPERARFSSAHWRRSE